MSDKNKGAQSQPQPPAPRPNDSIFKPFPMGNESRGDKSIESAKAFPMKMIFDNDSTRKKD